MIEPIKRNVEVDIHLTPKELAFVFCAGFSDEQAEFFNEVAKITKTWKAPFVFQLQSITDEDCLTDEARNVMLEIGRYSIKDAK